MLLIDNLKEIDWIPANTAAAFPTANKTNTIYNGV